MRPVKGKSQDEITLEWERIAKLRAAQIEKGRDLSFSLVLLPSILELTMESDFTDVIDIGCGSGFLTKELARKATRVVGIDLSQENIDIAQARNIESANIKFINTSVEDYSLSVASPRFTLAIANMSLMTTLHLDGLLESIARVLKTGAHFVFTITHPCFWPFYWEYALEDWFVYEEEIPIEAPFRISLETCNGLLTTHVHRPLEQYVSSLLKTGFIIHKILEPMPNKDIEAKYPSRWKYPRFLGMNCIRR
ncbi:MAG: class I SAM-dependent methyltransferase [candidate division Zixibacteria bacterium]|nr:class I SAM-dependent methyltransferase [candidate division Zixibacteria bacterium]